MEKQQYKLIAVDMDGTLLNDEKQIPQGNIEAIRQMNEAGYLFALSTGRPVCAIEKFIKLLGLTGPTICYNGAKIIKADTLEVLFEENLKESAALSIYEKALEFDVDFILWCDNELYANRVTSWTKQYAKGAMAEIHDLGDLYAKAKKGITKFIWIGEAKECNKWQQWYNEDGLEDVNAAASTPNYLEFFSANVSKAKAMEKIGELFDIKREEMIACGDMYNDQPMIEYAGLGVVMSNGAPDLKELAQYVTENDNNHSGVGEVIHKFILQDWE